MDEATRQVLALLPASIRGRVAVMPSGCIEWQGARYKSGHGQVRDGTSTRRVHRLAFERVVGLADRGNVLRHAGRANPSCCNVLHLQEVSRRGAVQAAIADGRYVPGRALRERTVCRNGHRYSPENTLTRSGGRRCRACARRRAVASRRSP